MMKVCELIDKQGYSPRLLIECHVCSHQMYFYSIPPINCDRCKCALPDYKKLMKDKDYRLKWHSL